MPTLLFRMLIIALMLPLVGYPMLLSGFGSDGTPLRTLVWLYPAYVLVAGVCAWMCYPKRKDVAWILLILLTLTHVGMYYLSL